MPPDTLSALRIPVAEPPAPSRPASDTSTAAAPTSASPARSAATITVAASEPGKAISPDLIGVFFEDISYSADGGLYAELIQNRSFEYNSAEQLGWHALTAWEPAARGDASGSLVIDRGLPLHANNPHYVVVRAEVPGEGFGLLNHGFDGIPVRAGETYDVAFFVRQCYMGEQWGPDSDIAGHPMPVTARLQTRDGRSLGETRFEIAGGDWHRAAGEIVATGTDDAAHFALLLHRRGGLALDEISLFPQKTFRGRKNGLRADLAQIIADLKPRFVRFPGGCVAHGNGLGNIYRWKDTVGPVEQRKGQPNLWGYHQSVGLGYFEYFQFCEDIGAMPLPVVAAGVCCQNSAHTPGRCQHGLPLAEMPAYIQDILDLVEWANGPADSKWGAVRAAAGHPRPFGLKYLGVGNEDKITPVFKERFRLIHDALLEKHPEIVVVGTSGPFAQGEDFELGWRFAAELSIPMLDEHYYVTPEWFWENLDRYDAYDRAGAKVYLGEYAAHEKDRRNTLRSAIAEAAYLTSLERNADIVRFSSYAPLFARRGQTRWSPDLVYFTNTAVYPSLNYEVQRLFGRHGGDRYLDTTILDPGASEPRPSLAASAVRDSSTGDLVVKIVNGANSPRPLRVELPGLAPAARTATRTVLAGPDPCAANQDHLPPVAIPRTDTLAISPAFDYDAPANSLTVLRITG
jgi:alpha-L-arabinofuranosidase